MTVVLLLVVMFSDASAPAQSVQQMPSVEICAQALTAHLAFAPPGTIDGHVVASWSASCVMYVKTTGS